MSPSSTPRRSASGPKRARRHWRVPSKRLPWRPDVIARKDATMTIASAALNLAVEEVILPPVRDLGDGFKVRRALPSAQRRMVGPFIFLDHFGPTVFRAG